MNEHVMQLIDMALNEDIGAGDVTSEYFVPKEAEAHAFVLVKQAGVVAGHELAKAVCQKVDPKIQLKMLVEEGACVAERTRVIELRGPAQSILTAERVMLNFMQRLSGIATKTSRFVAEVKHTKAKVLDTRKTTPGWRYLEKGAVVAGGGTNHRMGLYDRAMVKDNHLVAQHDIDSLQAAILQLKKDKPAVQVELETDTLAQVEAFLKLDGVDYILLDNMSCEQMEQAVAMRDAAGSKVLLEASGGVNLSTVKGIAETGVDFISVGALTHSAVALDISLEFIPVE